MDQDEEEDSRPVIPPPPVPLPLPTSSVQPQGRGSSRSTCDRCGQQYACTYLRYHQRRCVGVMAHAQADGRGGAGARIAAIRAEARGGRRGGRRRLPSTLHPDGREHGQARDLFPQRLRRLLDPPSLNDLRCHNQVKPETCLVRVALCVQNKVMLIGHLQFLFIEPRIQLREDMR